MVSGGNLALTVDEVDYSIKQVDCPADLKLSNYNGHKVELSGYTCGLIGAKQFGILTTELKDKGLDQLIYFEDDFEWLATYTTETGAGDAVATNDPSTTAPNVFGTADWCSAFQADFMGRGYGYFEGANLKNKDPHDWQIVDATHTPPYKVLYLQKNYLKFGKSDCNSGIILPAMSAIEGTADVTVEFDWCWQVTGSFNADIMTLTVEIVGNGKCADSNDALSSPIESAQSQESGNSKIEWQHASVNLTGIDKDTRIKIRPTNYDPYIENPSRGQNRWYLDNIKVLPAEGGTPGGGDDPNEVKLPVEWSIQTDANNFNETWPLANGSATEEGVSGYIASVTGTGTIWYNNEAGNAADLASGKKKTKLDIQALDPRVTGAWPGDYCQFKVPGVVSKGKKVRITFETRTSATNPKYWKLIYLDGNEWKAAAEIKTDKVEGTDVEFTHAMNADGATNVKVDATVTYSVKTENVVFRFVCQSAMGAGGDMLTAPNGGTWRLAVTDISTTEWQPRIQWGE